MRPLASQSDARMRDLAPVSPKPFRPSRSHLTTTCSAWYISRPRCVTHFESARVACGDAVRVTWSHGWKKVLERYMLKVRGCLPRRRQR